MTIVFIGSNPSIKSGSVQPFWTDTRSRKVLSSWLSQLPSEYITCIRFLNVFNIPTPNNRPLTASEIKNSLLRLGGDLYMMNPDKIIAVGKTAEKALTLLRSKLNFDFYAMPHSSGLNRQLNDPIYVEEKIKGLIEFITVPKDKI